MAKFSIDSKTIGHFVFVSELIWLSDRDEQKKKIDRFREKNSIVIQIYEYSWANSGVYFSLQMSIQLLMILVLMTAK